MNSGHTPVRWANRWLWSLGAILCAAAPTFAQTQYPATHLATVSPSGGKAGTTVEITLGGKDLDEVKELLFSHPGIKATFVPPPPPPPPPKKGKPKPRPPQPPRFKVTIPANVPLGTYDIRAIGKWGISNPRTFAVGDLDEVNETEPNNDVPQAQKVPLNTTINGVISSNVEVDYFQFTGKKGQTVVLYCAGSAIDSRLTPLVQLFDPTGKELAAESHYRGENALIAQPLPTDGDYIIRVTAFAYLVGNAEYFYRLNISTKPWIEAAFPPAVPPGKTTPVTFYGWNLPGGKTVTGEVEPGLQMLTVPVNAPAAVLDKNPLSYQGTLKARSASVDGFTYQLKNGAGSSNPLLLAYAEAPVVLDDGTNSMDKPQPINLPAEVCGQIEKRGDRDCYVFTAKKGEVYTFEGFADRLGSPIDLYFTIRRVDNNQRLGEFDDHPEIPSQVGQFFTYTKDPKGRFQAPVDGKYEVIISSRSADLRADPRLVYRVCIRKEEPNFHLVLIPTHEVSAAGMTLNQGASQYLQVVCLRHDGFDGEVALSAEGLPGGVTCQPQVVGPKLTQTAMVLTAAPGAGDWAGRISIKGTAKINGKTVVREARAGVYVWPSAQNQPAFSRLADSLALAVRPKGPYYLGASVKELTVPIGGKVSVKLTIKREFKDFTSQVQLQRLAGPAYTNGRFINVPNLNLPKNKNEATANFTIPTNAQPGVYNLVWRGLANYRYKPNPKSKKTTNVQVRAVTPPIKVTVYNQVADLELPEKVNAKVGATTPLVVKVKRLHDYKGPYQVQLVVPGGVPVRASNVQIPANANEVQLKLTVPKNSKLLTRPDVVVRLTARVGSATMRTEEKFTLAVVK